VTLVLGKRHLHNMIYFLVVVLSPITLCHQKIGLFSQQEVNTFVCGQLFEVCAIIITL